MRFSSFIILILTGSLLSAQNANTHLQNATKSYQEQSYLDALLHLDNAKIEIQKEYGSLIAKVLPESFGSFKNQNKDGDEVSFSQRLIYITKDYRAASANQPSENESSENNPEENEKFYIVTLTNNTNELSSEISDAHLSYNNENEEDRVYEAIKVKGYRGFISYEKEQKQGRLGVLIGSGLLKIESYNIEDYNSMKKYAEAIDFENIISFFGK